MSDLRESPLSLPSQQLPEYGIPLTDGEFQGAERVTETDLRVRNVTTAIALGIAVGQAAITDVLLGTSHVLGPKGQH